MKKLFRIHFAAIAVSDLLLLAFFDILDRDIRQEEANDPE